MLKKLAHCAPVLGTMDHWVKPNKYIESLLIWFHVIFILI